MGIIDAIFTFALNILKLFISIVVFCFAYVILWAIVLEIKGFIKGLTKKK